MSPSRAAVVATFALAFPSVAGAQGLVIDHKPVGCIVAGKFARLNACFTPAGDVVRPRVNFRIKDPKAGAASYYVEMQSDMPCHMAFLPKAKKEMVGKELEIWLEGMDRAFNPGRTPEYTAQIVGSEGECRKDLPVAPWVTNAAVTVFPAMPAGFVAASAVPLTTIAAVGGATLATAGGVYAATRNDDEPTPVQNTPNPTPTPTPAPTPAPTPTPTATPTPPPGTTATLDCTVRPRSGVAPLTVSYTAAAAGFAGPVNYRWDFGDGASTTDRDTTHTYTTTGTFRAIVFASDGAQTLSCDRNVVVSRPEEIRHSLDVSLTGTGSGTVGSSPAGINCAPDCTETYLHDTVVSLVAVPAGNSIFVEWTGACSGSGGCSVLMNTDQTVGAKFDLRAVPATLTVVLAGSGSGDVDSDDGFINCQPDCTETYPNTPVPVTLRAAPAQGSLFQGWSGGGCSGTGPCTLTLTANTTVTATFAPAPPVTLTVNLGGQGFGNVTSDDGGIGCQEDCSETYPTSPVTVTLRASPSQGSFFQGWSGGGCGGTAPCTLTLTADTTVTANFQPNPVTLEVTCLDARRSGTEPFPAGSASVSPGGFSCASAPNGQTASGLVAPGAFVSISATAVPNTTFIRWGGHCESLGTVFSTTSTCTFDMPSGGPVQVFVTFGAGTPVPQAASRPAPQKDEDGVALAWRHQLDLAGGAGQVLLNGATTVAAGPGLNSAQAQGRPGENRLEGRLTRAAGKAGTWRFELGANLRLEPGSIRILSGEPTVVTGDTVVFRLRGHPGENVAFTFRLKR